MVASIGLSHGRRSRERRAPGPVYRTMAGKGLDSVPTLRSVPGGLGGASRFKLEAYLRISYSILHGVHATVQRTQHTGTAQRLCNPNFRFMKG